MRLRRRLAKGWRRDANETRSCSVSGFSAAGCRTRPGHRAPRRPVWLYHRRVAGRRHLPHSCARGRRVGSDRHDVRRLGRLGVLRGHESRRSDSRGKLSPTMTFVRAASRSSTGSATRWPHPALFRSPADGTVKVVVTETGKSPTGGTEKVVGGAVISQFMSRVWTSRRNRSGGVRPRRRDPS